MAGRGSCREERLQETPRRGPRSARDGIARPTDGLGAPPPGSGGRRWRARRWRGRRRRRSCARNRHGRPARGRCPARRRRSGSSPCAGPGGRGAGSSARTRPGIRPSSGVSASSERVEQHLHAEADAEQGLVRRLSGSTSPASRSRSIAKARRADAREDQALGGARRRRGRGPGRPRPRAAQRRGGSNRCCHSQGRGWRRAHSMPLVDGSASPRPSIARPWRSARPNALKQASTL